VWAVLSQTGKLIESQPFGDLPHTKLLPTAKKKCVVRENRAHKHLNSHQPNFNTLHHPLHSSLSLPLFPFILSSPFNKPLNQQRQRHLRVLQQTSLPKLEGTKKRGMASWHPDPQSLNTLYQLIVNSKSVDSNTRIEAAQVTLPTSPHPPPPLFAGHC
jgi:hypothetical protein